jgi:hypothetical protein
MERAIDRVKAYYSGRFVLPLPGGTQDEAYPELLEQVPGARDSEPGNLEPGTDRGPRTRN